MNICERGAENLVAGIIKQAVDDYIKAKHFLDESYDANTYCVNLIKQDAKQQKHRQSIRTLNDAYDKREFERSKAKAEINSIVKWFNGDQYKSYTELSGMYILQMANERYLEEKIEIEQKAFEEAERLKNMRRREFREKKRRQKEKAEA